MKFKAIIEQQDSAVWHFSIRVPDEITEELSKDGEKRVICKLNNSIEFQCALMPQGDLGHFINVNKEIRKKLNIGTHDSVDVELKKDNSKYGLPMPEEFQEVLNQDPEGDQVFHSLTLGKQRSLLHIAGKPKSQDIRIKKAWVIIDYLKSVNGKLDFKELNEAFKNNK